MTTFIFPLYMHSRVQRLEISVSILAIHFHIYFVIMYINVCYFLFFPTVFCTYSYMTVTSFIHIIIDCFPFIPKMYMNIIS